MKAGVASPLHPTRNVNSVCHHNHYQQQDRQRGSNQRWYRRLSRSVHESVKPDVKSYRAHSALCSPGILRPAYDQIPGDRFAAPHVSTEQHYEHNRTSRRRPYIQIAAFPSRPPRAIFSVLRSTSYIPLTEQLSNPVGYTDHHIPKVKPQLCE